MTTKEQKLTDEIHEIQKRTFGFNHDKLITSDYNKYMLLKSELKGRQEARKELIEEFEKMIYKEEKKVKSTQVDIGEYDKFISVHNLKQHLKELEKTK